MQFCLKVNNNYSFTSAGDTNRSPVSQWSNHAPCDLYSKLVDAL